jgi:hypothetical protein
MPSRGTGCSGPDDGSCAAKNIKFIEIIVPPSCQDAYCLLGKGNTKYPGRGCENMLDAVREAR